MRLALPIDAPLIDQLQVGLMHQRGGLDGLARRLAAKDLLGQVPESLIDGVEQPIDPRAVSRLEVLQEIGDFGRRLRMHQR